MLRGALPGLYVTAGTELSREWSRVRARRTAAANAYVGPACSAIFGRLESASCARALRQDNCSSHGLQRRRVFGPSAPQRSRSMLVESGPVGGCIGAGVYADGARPLARSIAFDMGGTTAEVRPARGRPLRSEIALLCRRLRHTASPSAAGCSISSRSAPAAARSPGSTSRVACRRAAQRGLEPRAGLLRPAAAPTDDHRRQPRARPIGAASFLGGEMTLDAAAARRASRSIAAPLGITGGRPR